MVLIILCFRVEFCAQCMHLKYMHVFLCLVRFGLLSGRLLEKFARSAYGLFSLYEYLIVNLFSFIPPTCRFLK